VTLHDLNLTGAGRDGTLGLDATARTYRYLDANEVAAQKKPAGAKK
jgi:type IV pilus assembly protein PilO